jgi:hypothetical protein
MQCHFGSEAGGTAGETITVKSFEGGTRTLLEYLPFWILSLCAQIVDSSKNASA